MGWLDYVPVIGQGYNLIKGANTPTNTQVLDEDRAAAQKTAQDLMFERDYAHADTPINVNAPTTSATTIASRDVNAPTIDTANADAIRAKQLQQTDALQASAEGRAPSVAAAKYARDQQEIAHQQEGLAGQARGTSAIAARRDAMTNIGSMKQKSAADEALLRASEMAGSRQALTGALSGMREADTGLAVEQARQGLEAGKTSAQLALEAGRANQATDLESQRANQASSVEAQRANQQALLEAQQQNRQYKLGLGGQVIQAQGNAAQVGQNKVTTAQSDAARKVQGNAAILSGIGSAAAAAMALSDERAKEDIEPVPASEARSLAEDLLVKRFRYKDDPSGDEHFGVVAQDLEKNPLGRELVHEGPDGLKHVDYQGLTALLLEAVLSNRAGRMAREAR